MKRILLPCILVPCVACPVIAGQGDHERSALRTVDSADILHDLVVARGTAPDSNIFTFYGNGGGAFAAEYEVSQTWQDVIRMVAGDVNGDGNDDLVLEHYAGISVMLRAGGGKFERTQVYHDRLGVRMIDDFNRDGIADIAGIDFSVDLVWVRLGTGDETGAMLDPEHFDAGSHVGVLASGDFNGDGYSDLTVTATDKEGVVAILLNRGDGSGSFADPLTYSVPTLPMDPTVGRFNDDQWDDFALVGGRWGNHDIYVHLSNGDGTFSHAKVHETGFFGAGNIDAVGDFNGDGWDDLVIATFAGLDEDSRTVILLSEGDGTFVASQDWTEEGDMRVADLDGDGVLDIVRLNGFLTSSVITHLGNGDGTFAAGVEQELDVSHLTALALLKRNGVSVEQPEPTLPEEQDGGGDLDADSNGDLTGSGDPVSPEDSVTEPAEPSGPSPTTQPSPEPEHPDSVASSPMCGSGVSQMSLAVAPFLLLLCCVRSRQGATAQSGRSRCR